MIRRLVLGFAVYAFGTCPLVTARPLDVTLFISSSARSESGHLAPTRRLTPTTPSTSCPRRRRRRPRPSHLHLARYDNLVSGIAEISMGTSIGVLWSEYAVLTTGCGPLNLSDGLERVCYQAVIVAAGFVVFTRIVTGKNASELSQDFYGELQEFTLVQVRAAEWLLSLAVLGAFVALGSQMYNGNQMDGMSGIDVQMCRAIKDL